METSYDLAEEMKECIHLTKNTKGYNWELKIFPMPANVLDNAGQPTGQKHYTITMADIDRLELLNKLKDKKE